MWPPLLPPVVVPVVPAVPAVSTAPPEPACPAPALPPPPFALLQATVANTASARAAALIFTLNQERPSKYEKAAYAERRRTTKGATVYFSNHD
jgi:hypothetical protein